jgi:alanine-glyoxylate transaminase/serine-glyoxylate transaminase/serine-pyruvate transaminase
MTFRSGRHFLQIPGPTNVPDRVLRAMNRPTIDHRGPDFAELGHEVLDGLKDIFKTRRPVVIYAASGTGAWEAALVNTLSFGNRVLMAETGHFALGWQRVAVSLGLEVDILAGDWRHGVNADAVEAHLIEDKEHSIKAVAMVHNETSTGVKSNVAAVRKAIDRAHHPALLMVDTISSLASMDYRHDEWGVDITVGGSQKGLMLPPGLSFNAISDKALAASASATLPRAYWDWHDMLSANKNGFFPTTPATSLLYGLRESLQMLGEEGLDNVFARHERHAEATRRAVRAWGLGIVCLFPEEYSASLTAVMLPAGLDADRVRQIVLQRFDMSLGMGLGKLQGKVFRIGHLGDFNDLSLAGTLCGVEMGLELAGISVKRSGVTAALEYLMHGNSRVGESTVEIRVPHI